MSIAKAYGVNAAEGMTGSGNVSLDVHATGPIKNTNAMNFSGNGALQNVVLKTPSLTQPVNVKTANLQFTQNSVNLTNFAASLGSTNANGNVSIANFDAPNLRFNLNIDKMNVAELQKITGGSAPPAKTACQLEPDLQCKRGAGSGSAAQLPRHCDRQRHGRGGHHHLRQDRSHQRSLQRQLESRSHPTEPAYGADLWRADQRRNLD